jgi:D-3-phosphoglycerate dehydrogenase
MLHRPGARRRPRLKVISKWGAGIDSIDQDACRRRGIAICNTPKAFSESVADSVLGYLLSFVRNLTAMDRQMKQGIWDKTPGRALRECTLGILGTDDISLNINRLKTRVLLNRLAPQELSKNLIFMQPKDTKADCKTL